ncbi:hypothetical protein C8R42DRAFT_781535 [Lentinula raphanica]|nr:hypothetical protein C8R42DRAFT_781535 [Lentinula raphanica]
MSSDEQALLASDAQVVLFNIANIIVVITGYGAFVLGTTIAILSLLRYGHQSNFIHRFNNGIVMFRRYPLRHSPTSRGLLVCLIVIFICFTWGIFYFGGLTFYNIKYTFIESLPAGLSAQGESASKRATTWQYMPMWPGTIIILLSDCIVARRAWLLFQQERFWRLTLVVLMVANIGVGIAFCIQWDDFRARAEDIKYISLTWISNTLSLTVNLCSTLLIALKAWTLHRAMTNAGLHNKTRVQRILLLLIESGAVFCAIDSVYDVIALLVIYMAFDDSSSPFQILNLIHNTSSVVSACYPVAVMILAYNDISPVADFKTLNLQTMHNFQSNTQRAVGQRRDRAGAAGI